MRRQPGQRRVLVTGASRGIGAAVARAFAEIGDTVALHYGSSAAAAEQVRAALPGSGHLTIQAELHDAARLPDLIRQAVQRLRGLDVLVNNAGVFTAHPPGTTTWDHWQRTVEHTLAVNLVAPAHLSYLALPHLIEAGGGAIVNVGSRGAFRGEPDSPTYGASKAGLHALGQSLAVAFAPHGISVASVSPGFVATDMAAAHLAGPDGDAIRNQSPFGRVATTQEVAVAVRWLASPEAAFASGTVLDVNGASYLR